MLSPKNRSRAYLFLVYLALIVGVVYAGFPVLWMLVSSIKPNSEIFAAPPKIIPKIFTLDAYRAILGNPSKVRFFINSYLVSISVTALTLFCCNF